MVDTIGKALTSRVPHTLRHLTWAFTGRNAGGYGRETGTTVVGVGLKIIEKRSDPLLDIDEFHAVGLIPGHGVFSKQDLDLSTRNFSSMGIECQILRPKCARASTLYYFKFRVLFQ